MASKSSASLANWSDDDTMDILEIAYSPTSAEGVTELDEFDAECPCCGMVISFRLFCQAVAHETETER